MANEIGKGWGIKAGFHIQENWGEPAPVAATDQLLLLSEAIQVNNERLIDDSLSGKAGLGGAEQGNLLISGKLGAYLRYHDRMQALIKMAFGTRSNPALVNGNVYKDNFKLADSLEGLYGTLVIDKGVKIFEYSSIKVDTVEMSVNAGERLKVALGIIARSLDRDSLVNGEQQIALLSLLDSANPSGYITAGQLEAYLGASSGPALGQDNLIPVRSFSFKLENKLTDDLVESGIGGYISEPLRGAHRKVSLELVLGKYQADDTTDTWLDAYENGTALKCILRFTGKTIEGAYKHQFVLYFPQLYITKAPRHIEGAGLISAPLSMVATMPDSAVLGMESGDDLLTSDVLEEVRIAVQNRQSSDLI